MKARILAIVACMIAGCSSDPVTQGATKTFADGTQKLSSALQDELSSVTKVRRREYYNDVLKKGLPLQLDDKGNKKNNIYVTERYSFAEFACLGRDDFSSQRASLSVLTNLAGTTQALSASAATTQADVEASLTKYKNPIPDLTLPDALKNESTETQLWSKCATSLDIDLAKIVTTPDSSDRFAVAAGIAAGVAVYQAGKALYDAGQALHLDFEKVADERQRQARLKEFLTSSATSNAITKVFKGCADKDYQDDKTTGQTAIALVNSCLATQGSDLNDDQLAIAYANHIRYTLPLAYYQWLAFLDAAGVREDAGTGSGACKGDTKNSKAAEAPQIKNCKPSRIQLAHAAEAAETVMSNLSEYDALRATDSPKGSVASIVLAWRNLLRIERGQLTSDEQKKQAYADIQQFFQFATSVYNDGKAVVNDANTLKSSVEKLPSSLN